MTLLLSLFFMNHRTRNHKSERILNSTTTIQVAATILKSWRFSVQHWEILPQIHKTYLRNSTAPKYPLQHCNGTSNNDLIRHILQLVGSFTSHKGNEDWRLVEIPKQEKLSTIGCCASNVTKEISVWIPKHSIKTQNDLQSTKRHVNRHNFPTCTVTSSCMWSMCHTKRMLIFIARGDFLLHKRT